MDEKSPNRQIKITAKYTAYTVYKGEKPSVRLSVGIFFQPSVSPWFLPGSTPDMLDMKRPSLQITKNVFKKVLIAVVRRPRRFECLGVDDFLLNLQQHSCKPQPRRY